MKQKIFILLFSTVFLFYAALPVIPSYADTVPTPPTAPSAPSAPSSPTSFSQPQQTQPTDTPTTTPSQTSSTTPTPTPTSTASQTLPAQTTPTPTPTVAQQATTSSPQTSTSTNANNSSHDPSNTANGAGSTNTSSSTQSQQSTTTQINTSAATNTLTQAAVTGGNNTSDNVGSTAVTTQDANVSGTVVNAQNTNIDGVAVSEFNVNDNHTGDIILNFNNATCPSCSTPSQEAQNSGNGAGSTNASFSHTSSTDTTFQKNDASTGNTLTLTADSGDNIASQNTNGSTSVQTGNANVEGNALTFLNNNLAGKVVLGLVNIYGDLTGNIILPQSALDGYTGCSSCTNSTTAQNTGNGGGSTNTAATNSSSTATASQTNDATVSNALALNSTTGNNDATKNTGGAENVQVGKASISSQILNVINSNITDGNVWLVLIHNAGEWIGKIVGLPTGATVDSSGLRLSSDTQGTITASNTDNGAGSTNTTNTSSTTNTTTTQSNQAQLGNILHLSANTGGNTANDNTGGDVTIKTGDAKVIANLINFVDNNITGKGKLFVTIVNVFGKWLGDFVGPNQQAPSTPSVGSQTQPTATATTTQQETQQVVTTQITHPTSTLYSTNNNPYHPSFIPSQTKNTLSSFAPLKGITTPQTEVAGIQTSQAGKTLTLNLAWVLLLTPLGGLAIILKRRFFAH